MFNNASVIVDEIIEVIKGQGNVVIENDAIFENIIKDLTIETEEKELLNDFVSKNVLSLLRESLNKKKSADAFKKDLYSYIKSNEENKTLDEKNFLFDVFYGVFYYSLTQQKIAPEVFSNKTLRSLQG